MSSRPLRRRALAWSAPIVIVLLVVAARLLSLGPINASAQGLLDDGSPTDAAGRFELLGPLNFAEPWIEPFNIGVAHYGDDDFVAAEADFRTALDRSPGGNAECRVRHNLAISVEAQGDDADADGEVAEARELWTEALEIVTEGDCIDGDGEVAERLSEDEQRLLDKLNPDGSDGGDDDDEPDDTGGGGDDSPPQPSQPDPETASNLEELERRGSEAVEQDRQDSTFDRRDSNFSGGDRW